MSLNDQLLQILAELLEKSRAGNVKWQAGDRDDEYYVSLAASTLRMQYIRPETEYDRIAVVVTNIGGRELWRLVAEQDMPGWSEIHELWMEAKRRALGVDATLAEIKREIREQATVGIPF